MTDKKFPVTTYLSNSDLDKLFKIHAKTGAPLSHLIRKAVQKMLEEEMEV